MKYAPYVLKTLWGHRTRTLLTISGSAVALFVFCFVGAIGEGLDRLSADVESERTLIAFQANRFCPFTSALPQDYEYKIAKLPGVANVVPIKVYTNNCRASLDVIVFHGIPAERLQSFRDMDLVAGSWEEFHKVRDAAFVGESVARRRNLSVGQKFSIGGVTVLVSGIFQAAEPTEEDFIYTHLEFLQRMRGQNSVGTVTQFEIQTTDAADPQTVAEAVDALFRAGPVATDTRPKGVFQANSVQDLTELIGFAHWLGYACVLLVLGLVSTTTTMAVQDRVSEHGVLQTLGFSGRMIFGLVIIESVLVSFAGGMLGVAAAMATLAYAGLTVGAEAVTIAFSPSASLASTGLLVAMVVGVAAGLVPGWQAARTNIVAALRHA